MEKIRVIHAAIGDMSATTNPVEIRNTGHWFLPQSPHRLALRPVAAVLVLPARNTIAQSIRTAWFAVSLQIPALPSCAKWASK